MTTASSNSVNYNESEFVSASVQEKIGVKTIVIFALELPLLIFGFVSCAIFFRVVLRTRCFHQNLRFLLGNFSCSFLIVCLSRFMIICPLGASFIFNMDISEIGWCRIAKALHDCGLYVGAINIIVIVIERSVATIKVATYETRKTPILGIFLVNFQWLFSLLFVWFNQVNAQPLPYSTHLTHCQREYTSKVLTYFLLAVLCLDFISMALFLLLLHINKRRYDQKNNSFTKHYTLSSRYQIVENIRTTRLLYPLVIAYLLGSAVGISLLIVGGQVAKRLREENEVLTLANHLYATNWGQCFDVLFAVLSIAFPHLAIHGHHSLLREFRKILLFDKEMRRNMSSSNRRELKTLNGTKLIMSSSEERRLHFERLQNMWNGP